MTQQPLHTPMVIERWRSRWVPVIVIMSFVVLLFAVLNFYWYYPSQIGMHQPIPFSHRVHVTDKKLSCVMCHSGVFDSPHAGIPPLETCMLCHSRIIIHHEQIQKLRKHYEQGIPVEWYRVDYIPDFVFFNHQQHILNGFDCGKCHGDVAQMDRVYQVYKLQMGFCIQCHKEQGASHDCYICHR